MSTEPQSPTQETSVPKNEDPAPKKQVTFTDVSPPDPLPNQKCFDVHYVGREDGKTYKGTFKVSRLTIGAYARMRVEEARMNGGTDPGIETRLLNGYFAYFRVAFIEWPTWWNPENSYDLDPVVEIHDYARHWETSFRRKVVDG